MIDINKREQFEAEFVKTDYFNIEYRAKGISNPFSWNDSANRYVWHDIQAGWEMWDKAQARQAKAMSEPVLDTPACVGGGTFQPGVKWSTVILAAQRHYERDGHHERPVVSIQDQLRIASGHSVIVPIKVTDKMIESTDALPDGCTVDEIYEAMIKAAQEQNA